MFVDLYGKNLIVETWGKIKNENNIILIKVYCIVLKEKE